MGTRLKATAACGALLLAIPAMAAADDTPSPNAATVAETARLTAETARINAQAALTTAQAAALQAKITALGLPSFTGDTTLNGEAGKTETMQLASQAVQAASGKIVTGIGTGCDGGCVLLAGDEVVDYGSVASLTAEMLSIERQFAALHLDKPTGGRRASNFLGTFDTIVPIASAIAGLLRTETTVNDVALTELNAGLMVRAVAGKMRGRAYLPHAVTVVPDDSPLFTRLDGLSATDITAHKVRDATAAADKDRIAEIDAAIKRFEDFYKRVTTPDSAGHVPIASAAQLETLAGKPVLRIYVDRGSGSIVKVKNITTFFGADPIRISGGLVTSYALTGSDGGVKAAGIVVCRTAMARLRHIQDGSWASGNKTESSATCLTPP